MKRMRRHTLLMALIVTGLTAQSQTTEQFKPGGKSFMRIYSHFYTAFSDGNSTSAFGLTRFYLGHEHTLSKRFSVLGTIDVGDPGAGNLDMTAFVKYAYVHYHTRKFAAFFGMIPTIQFKVQEDFWGNRYLEKSYQDAYDFNSSADLGISVSYKMTDFLSADIIIQNGEGYKKLDSDSVFRTGFGMTAKPVTHLTTRVYYDFSSKGSTLSSLAFFAGYQTDRFRVAGEYNSQANYDFQKGHDLYGPSVYGAVRVAGKTELFARYDKLMSNSVSGTDWNISNDGELFMIGVDYSPVKGIRFSPNIRGWNPAQSGEPFSTSVYLNCEIKL